jgi:hypothetical protein
MPWETTCHDAAQRRAHVHSRHAQHEHECSPSWPKALDLAAHHLLLDIRRWLRRIHWRDRWPSQAVVFDRDAGQQNIAQEFIEQYGMGARPQLGDMLNEPFRWRIYTCFQLSTTIGRPSAVVS